MLLVALKRQPAARCSELGHVGLEKDAKESELQLPARYGQNDCVRTVEDFEVLLLFSSLSGKGNL
jgi:hypothetical protein